MRRSFLFLFSISCSFFGKCDIATVIDQVKQQHVEHYSTHNGLTSLTTYRTLQHDYKYAEYLLTVRCLSNRRLLITGRPDVGAMVYT